MTDHRLSITIPAKSAEFIAWLGDEAQRGGHRLSKAAIVRALLNVAMRLDADLERVRTQRDLEERLARAIDRRRQVSGRRCAPGATTTDPTHR